MVLLQYGFIVCMQLQLDEQAAFFPSKYMLLFFHCCGFVVVATFSHRPIFFLLLLLLCVFRCICANERFSYFLGISKLNVRFFCLSLTLSLFNVCFFWINESSEQQRIIYFFFTFYLIFVIFCFHCTSGRLHLLGFFLLFVF